MRLQHRPSARPGGVQQDRGGRLQPQALLGRLVELTEVDRLHPERRRGALVRALVVAQVQDRLGGQFQLAQHVLEQAAGLGHAVLRRAEHRVDCIGDILTGRRSDQGAQLRLVQIGVADDDHLEPAGLGLADQLHRRAEAETMARLGRELSLDQRPQIRLERLGVHAAVDFVEVHLVAPIGRRSLPRGPLGDHPLGRAEARQVREHVGRRVGVAPDQGVETVERQDAHLGPNPLGQGREILRGD